MGDWLGWVGTTSFLDLGCEGFPGFAGLFNLVTGACLGPIMTLGADFAVLPFLLVVVTFFRVGVSVTRSGVGWGMAGRVALTTQPPRTTWIQPGNRLSCSSDGSFINEIGDWELTFGQI